MAYAKDPVCGMEVDTDTDLKTEHDGETFYFCSRAASSTSRKIPRSTRPEYEPHM